MDELAKRLKLKLFRTSVKENFNVDQGKHDNDLVASDELLIKI